MWSRDVFEMQNCEQWAYMYVCRFRIDVSRSLMLLSARKEYVPQYLFIACGLTWSWTFHLSLALSEWGRRSVFFGNILKGAFGVMKRILDRRRRVVASPSIVSLCKVFRRTRRIACTFAFGVFPTRWGRGGGSWFRRNYHRLYVIMFLRGAQKSLFIFYWRATSIPGSWSPFFARDEDRCDEERRFNLADVNLCALCVKHGNSERRERWDRPTRSPIRERMWCRALLILPIVIRDCIKITFRARVVRLRRSEIRG